MQRPLHIAHCVELYAPSVGGMQEVVKQLSERMVRAGQRVTVLTTALPERAWTELNGVAVRGFSAGGNAVNGLTGDTASYWRALQNEGFDVITFFAAQQWTADAALPRLAELTARKVFVPTGFSRLNDPRYADYYRAMPGWMRQMDANVFHSTGYRDAVFARAHGVGNTVLIPNGAATEEFEGPVTLDLRARLGLPEGTPVVLHVGSFTGAKGQLEALRMFVEADTKDAALVLIGNGVQRLERIFRRHWRMLRLRWKASAERSRIFFLDPGRAWTVAAMRQADLFLFPSAVECSPIVLFESLAGGTPFLASDAGNAREIAEWTQGGWILPGAHDADGLVHPDIHKGAALLTTLLADQARLRATGAAGRQAWRERFTWDVIAQQYLALYQRISRSEGNGTPA